VRLTVPPGTQAGTRLVVKGRGMTRLRSTSRGELGVTLLVQTPTNLNDEQRELLREFAKLRDEDYPVISGDQHGKGFFSRLKDSLGG
jgi:molecular chaperone DnaJ